MVPRHLYRTYYEATVLYILVCSARKIRFLMRKQSGTYWPMCCMESMGSASDLEAASGQGRIVGRGMGFCVLCPVL